MAYLLRINECAPPSPRFIHARAILGAAVSVVPRSTTCRAPQKKPSDRERPCATRIASSRNQCALPISQQNSHLPQPPPIMSRMSCRDPSLLLTPYVFSTAGMGVKPSRCIPFTPEYPRKASDLTNRVDYRSSRPVRLPRADPFAVGRYTTSLP